MQYTNASSSATSNLLIDQVFIRHMCTHGDQKAKLPSPIPYRSHHAGSFNQKAMGLLMIDHKIVSDSECSSQPPRPETSLRFCSSANPHNTIFQKIAMT